MSGEKEPATESGVQLMNMIPDVPAAVGPYSQLSVAGDFVFLSGQLPMNPATGQLPASIEEQTEQVFDNVEAALRGVGLALTDVARASVYLTDMGSFSRMNDVYAQRFGGHRPARETLGVNALALGAEVEITIVAYKRRA